jgi:hypothetical protein
LTATATAMDFDIEPLALADAELVAIDDEPVPAAVVAGARQPKSLPPPLPVAEGSAAGADDDLTRFAARFARPGKAD